MHLIKFALSELETFNQSNWGGILSLIEMSARKVHQIPRQ